MKAGLLITGNGALIYLTSYDSFMNDKLKEKLASKGITKFIAYEIPVEEAKKNMVIILILSYATYTKLMICGYLIMMVQEHLNYFHLRN